MPTPYVKQTWIDGVAGGTPISAARLAYMESGIDNSVQVGNTWVDLKNAGLLGDGVTDESTVFENAIASANRIHVPLGYTFLLGDADVIGRKTLEGAGTIRKAATATQALHMKGAGGKLDGLHFTADPAAAGQPNMDVKLGDGASDLVIDGCFFDHAMNESYSCIGAAVDSDVGGSPYTTPVKGVVIVNNRLTGTVRPLHLHSIENLLIEGNIIRNCGADGIRLRENVGYTQILGNQFFDIGDPSWAEDLQTRDAIDTYWSGQRLTIANNIVRTTAYAGFDIKGSAPSDAAATSDRLIITGNQIYGTRHGGIILTGLNGGYVAFADISHNHIEGCGRQYLVNGGSPGEGGIELRQAVQYVRVTDNTIVRNYLRGIYIQNKDAAAPGLNRRLKVKDNIVVNNGLTGQTSYGIIAQGCEDTDIEGNHVYNDATLANPEQSVGILSARTNNGFTATDLSVRIDKNNVRGHASGDIVLDPANEYASHIASYDNNATGTIQRNWHYRRRVFHGTAVPGVAEGYFERGDIIWELNPAAAGKVGRVCITSGRPGTWKPFGVIDA